MKRLIFLLLICFELFCQNVKAQLPPPCGIAGDEPPGCTLCGTIYAGTTGGYSPNITPPGFCGTIENNQWLLFVADATMATITITSFNCQNGQGVQLYMLDLNLNPVSNCFSSGGNNIPGNIFANGLTPGEPYYIMIDGFAGDVCDFVIQVIGGIDDEPLDSPGPITAMPDVSLVCSGAKVCYSVAPVNGATKYQWEVPGFGVIISGPGTNEICVIWRNLGSGEIKVTATNPCSSSLFVTRPIDVVNTLPPTILPPLFVCLEDFPIQLDNRTFNNPGTYSFTEQSVTGCDSVVIYNIQAITPGLMIIDTTICGGMTYQFDSLIFDQEGQYRFVFDCDTIQLNLNVMEDVEILSFTDSLVCADSCVQLVVDAQLNNPDLISQWSANPGTVFPGPGDFEALACGAGDFVLSFLDTLSGEQCRVITNISQGGGQLDTVDINSFQPPANNYLCVGQQVDFRINPVSGASSYHWIISGNADLINQNANQIQLQLLQPGDLEICVSALNNCDTSAVVCATYQIIPIPTPDISYPSVICQGEVGILNFNGTTGPNSLYTWDFQGATILSGQGGGPFEARWDDPGIKNIGLVVYDRGCVAALTPKTVNVSPVLSAPVVNCIPDQNAVEMNWATTPGVDYQFRILSGQTISASNVSFIQVENLDAFEEVVLELTSTSPVCPARTDTFSCRSLGCPAYPIDIQPLGPFCQNDPIVQLNADVGGNPPPIVLNWSGEGVISGGRFSPALAGVGLHRIQVYFEANSCSYAEDVTVEVFVLPEATSRITPAGIWFPGANIGAIDLEILRGAWPFSYLWDNLETTQDLTDLGPGRYCLFLEDGNGCREQYCYTVTGGFYKISPFHLLCRGDSKRLSIRPQTGATFNWSPADGLSCTDCPNPIASLNQTTQYTVTATLPGGFSESTNVVVVVLPPPFCDFAQSREFDTKEEAETFLRPYNLKIESKSVVTEDILLSPNPTSGQITIRSKTNIERVEVLDNLGRAIQTFIPDSRDFSFDLSGVKGSRILKIVTNDRIVFRKVMLSN